MNDSLLLHCGVAAGPLFTLVHLVEGARRADYNSLRHPVSSLSLGRAGWVQVANFLGLALLSAVFAVGLWREGDSRWGALLVGVWAVGILGAGVFRTDPVRGYPSGTPDRVERPSRAGASHDLLSLLAFLALLAACCVYAFSGGPGWAVYSLGSGVAFAGFMVWSSAAFASSGRSGDFGGLLQRASLAIGCLWLTVLALRTLHP
ncbi:hypothetical protein GCM10010329_53840 [Streptomyces spiroverticillatus]|uniref:DUF998 domain-containing protein n=1 Tax=Streptomyces finlayi TaxID=67296 RepID=A0A918X239_9ACTN|nr:DUF998 domain-containing protein [Streptomyces finlayi]GHA23652.1 hypothetical protein GCM10010329_53840 [Streptomyces spiroverticillatus]GHD04874.1 hypothetical protein GCM10010334_54760 [Streptomyces finlayi]